MYSKLGSLKYANIVYLLPYKNLVVLNFMISGYSRNCVFYKSIDTFSETFGLGLIPDSMSITSILALLSLIAALKKGKMVHGYQVRNGIICDIPMENVLLLMYTKCGCLIYTQIIFERIAN